MVEVVGAGSVVDVVLVELGVGAGGAGVAGAVGVGGSQSGAASGVASTAGSPEGDPAHQALDLLGVARRGGDGEHLAGVDEVRVAGRGQGGRVLFDEGLPVPDDLRVGRGTPPRLGELPLGQVPEVVPGCTVTSAATGIEGRMQASAARVCTAGGGPRPSVWSPG